VKFGRPQQTGRLVAVIDAQPFEGLAQMVVDRVVGDAQRAADFLAVEMLIDESENLAFTIGQPIHAPVPILVVAP
jgi:hypothetical protein